MRILMCKPEFFDIEYEINPWMNVRTKADKKRATAQWEELHKTILACGAKVELVSPARGLPDMAFAANAGLYYKENLILSHFKVIERKGETAYFQAWFHNKGFDVINRPGVDQSSAYFEGAGDALPAGDKLFAGYGFRSEKRFYEEAEYLDQESLVYCELTDPYFYHIDTCFCPLNETQAIWYPKAFSKESQKRMENAIELFEVPEAEAKRFGCNSVVLKKQVIIPSGCPKLAELLQSKGFVPHPCPVDEYIKAGGACKCLTLSID